MGFDPSNEIITHLAHHQKCLNAVSITSASMHSRLAPYFVLSSLQDHEINSFSWIGLDAESDMDVITQLARTQYKSLQKLQLVFVGRFESLRDRKDPPMRRARDTGDPYPVFMKLYSLSLKNVDLWNMGLELVDKLNLLHLSCLKIADCSGIGELLKYIADHQQLVPKLLTVELEIDYSWVEALQKVLCRFETLRDFRLQVRGYGRSVSVPDIIGLSKHPNLRRFSCGEEVNSSDMGLLRPLENHDMSLSYLGTSTMMECLSLYSCAAALVSNYQGSIIEETSPNVR